MTPLRLGIVGAGSIVAKKHLLALAEVPEIAVVGLWRRDAGALQGLADRFRIPRRYTDYRDLLSDPGIDAVLVATGPAAQPRIVLEAAAAGKHVFAEQPMAATAAEARAMAAALRHSPVYVQIGFNKRFYFDYRTARDLIRAGELGAPTGFHARFWFQPGRADPLLHNGTHFLDLARFFMGPVDEVLARRAEPQASAATTAGTWAVSLRFGSGAVGNLLLSSLASWDYVNEHVDPVGSNHNALSVESGRVLQMFRHGDASRTQLFEKTLSGHWWSGNEEQGFTGQFRVFVVGPSPESADRFRGKSVWNLDAAQSGGGTLIDNGVHVLDLARWFMGAEFVEAQGFLTHTLDLCEEAPDGTVRVSRRSECEDNAFGLLRTADGRVASVHSSWVQWQGYLYLEIFGTHGSLVVDNDQIQGQVSSHVFERHGEPIATTIERPALAKPDPSWRRHLQELLDAIREERDPVPSGYDGLRAARMVHALYRSAVSGKTEPIPADAPAV